MADRNSVNLFAIHWKAGRKTVESEVGKVLDENIDIALSCGEKSIANKDH